MNETHDPVAQALEQLRSAGAKNVGKIPEAPRKRTGASDKKRGRPTRIDGRADLSYRAPQRAGEVFSAVIRRQGWSKNLSVGQIMNAWPELVGPNVAAHTKPVKYDAEACVLIIQSDSTAWATQLRLIQKKILQAITRKVGPDIVTQVKILAPNIRQHNPGRLRVRGRGPRDDFG